MSLDLGGKCAARRQLRPGQRFLPSLRAALAHYDAPRLASGSDDVGNKKKKRFDFALSATTAAPAAALPAATGPHATRTRRIAACCCCG